MQAVGVRLKNDIRILFRNDPRDLIDKAGFECGISGSPGNTPAVGTFTLIPVVIGAEHIKRGILPLLFSLTVPGDPFQKFSGKELSRLGIAVTDLSHPVTRGGYTARSAVEREDVVIFFLQMPGVFIKGMTKPG